jgi:hypothetical protein
MQTVASRQVLFVGCYTYEIDPNGSPYEFDVDESGTFTTLEIQSRGTQWPTQISFSKPEFHFLRKTSRQFEKDALVRLLLGPVSSRMTLFEGRPN